MKNRHAADVGCVLLLLLIAAAVMLMRNNALPMQLWDESRNANNALEMSRNGNIIVTYFNGAPDRWNTKPPLLIWFMALLLRMGMPPLLAVRLPSIVAATASVLLVWAFCRNYLNDRLAGLFAGLTLLSAPLFVGWHAGRTGDFDAFVTFFTLLYTLAYWNYLESEGGERLRSSVLVGIAISLSILTKGVGGVLALPDCWSTRLLVANYSDPARPISLAFPVCNCNCVSGYFGLREHLDPGYLRAVWINDVAGRYVAVNPVDHGGPLFYIQVLASKFEPASYCFPSPSLPCFKGIAVAARSL